MVTTLAVNIVVKNDLGWKIMAKEKNEATSYAASVSPQMIFVAECFYLELRRLRAARR